MSAYREGRHIILFPSLNTQTFVITIQTCLCFLRCIPARVCVYACLQMCMFVVCSRLVSKIVHKYVSVHAITPQVAEPVFGARSEMPSSVSVCPNISSLHPCYLLRRPASSSSGPGLRHCKPVLSVLAIVTRERGGGLKWKIPRSVYWPFFPNFRE